MGEVRESGAHELVSRTSDEAAERAIRVHDPRIEVDEGDPERSLIEDLTELLLAFAELLLRALAFGHVTEAAHTPDRCAVHELWS